MSGHPRSTLAALSALAILTACADRMVTQYAGTAMSESAPEAAAALELTLYSRTDTSFSGVIELGPPAHGTGSAYAWPEGSELHVVTVGTESGDTIHWISRLTGRELGGRFEITGGKREGQRGTWRAHLVQGLPATEATLRARPATPLPPASAAWPLLLLVLGAIVLTRWIRRAPAPIGGDAPAVTAPPSRLAGVGGWLAFFAMARVLGLVMGIVRLPTDWNDYAASMGVGTAVAGMRPVVVLETVFSFLALPLGGLGLVLLFRRNRHAPRFWFAYLAASAAYLATDVLLTWWIHPHLARLVGGDAFSGEHASDTRQQLFRQLAFTLVWLLYWARSQRVRETYGAAALDRTVVVSLPGAPAAPDAPPMPGRRRAWRLIGRIATILGAAFLALVGYAFLTMRATPYSVPENTDIRTAVAGRWTWSRDTSGCRAAHTIAFSDDGNVMTIASSDVGATEEPTVYDILFVTRSTIRGAIRGEKRVTDEGKPVVWDLVLTGPDEYRWQRTDWTRTPWSYTGRIQRCPALPIEAPASP